MPDPARRKDGTRKNPRKGDITDLNGTFLFTLQNIRDVPFFSS
jgi:hypothetical protein